MVESKKFREKIDTFSEQMKKRVNGLADEIRELEHHIKDKANVVGEETKQAAERLTGEVKELQQKLRGKMGGVSREVEETVDRLSQQAKKLKERIRDVVPFKKKSQQVPVQVRTGDAYLMDPITDLRHAPDRLFDEFFQEFARRPLTPWRDPFALGGDFLETGWPPVEVSETEEEIRVKAEIPGVAADDLEVSLSADTLDIRGEKTYRKEKKDWNKYVMESSYGSFQRTIPLSCEVDQEKIKAEHKKLKCMLSRDLQPRVQLLVSELVALLSSLCLVWFKPFSDCDEVLLLYRVWRSIGS